MKARVWIITLLAAMCMAALPVAAQRRVNPVKAVNAGLQGKNENRQAADSLTRAGLVESIDELGNTIYIDTIAGTEVADSTNLLPPGAIPKMQQPLIYAAAVGVDVWDPVMRLFGQRYGITEISAELNLHNRYIPVVEAGIGAADYQPDGNNFRFHVAPTPYLRIGANYNFLYNSNPDYLVYAGLRFGWSHFNFDVDRITLAGDYWGDPVTFSLPHQTSNATYLQVLFGLRVKIAGPVSLGWSIRAKAMLHQTKCEYGQPYYLPGYGAASGLLTGSFSLTYTIPLKKKPPLPDTENP